MSNIGPRARINIDVTETLVSGKWTGIERVVRRLSNELTNGAGEAIDVRLIVAIWGRFHILNPAGRQRLFAPVAASRSSPAGGALANALLRLAPLAAMSAQAILKQRSLARAFEGLVEPGPADFEPRDVVLLLDSYWTGNSAITAARRARRTAGRVVSVVYDLIPITDPAFFSRSMAVTFPRRLFAAMRASHVAIAISRHSAMELRRWLGPRLPALEIDYFRLGNDPVGRTNVSRTGPVTHYAMIGTIEPRKGHGLVLDAFERRWAKGERCRLTIVGKIGWVSESFRNRLTAAARDGRLTMIHDADDEQLTSIMAEVDAVIMASKAEGFGLPIIEALAVDIPVVASDIPVFREIADGTASWFNPDDPLSLIEAMEWLERDAVAFRARAREFAWPSWHDAAAALASRAIAPPAPDR